MPARTTAAMLLKMTITKTCANIAKPLLAADFLDHALYCYTLSTGTSPCFLNTVLIFSISGGPPAFTMMATSLK